MDTDEANIDTPTVLERVSWAAMGGLVRLAQQHDHSHADSACPVDSAQLNS